MPPCAILVEALDVLEAKSAASTSRVRRPRNCASSAQPAPDAPPPMTQTSYVAESDWRKVSARVDMPLSRQVYRILPWCRRLTTLAKDRYSTSCLDSRN